MLKGTSGEKSAKSFTAWVLCSIILKCVFDFEIHMQVVNFGTTSVNIKVLVTGMGSARDDNDHYDFYLLYYFIISIVPPILVVRLQLMHSLKK